MFAVVFALLFLGCDQVDSVTSTQSEERGSAMVKVKVEPVGTLGKSRAINLTQLVLTLTNETDTISDTSLIDPQGSQSVTVPFMELTSLIEWKVDARTFDMSGEEIHAGSTTFSVYPKQTTDVSLDLSANYSQLVTHIFPVRDSVNDIRLTVDGELKASEQFAKQAKIGDTVSLEFDYLTASPAGVSHAIRLEAFGQMWAIDTLLYAADTTITVTSGLDETHTITLKWVGPNTPPPGQAEMSVVIGAVGTVEINGELEDTVVLDTLLSDEDFGTKTAGLFRDVRDGQVYSWKRYGNQIWMTRNLNYAASGSHVGPGLYGPTDEDGNIVNGRYYDFNVANRAGTVPAGWHIPTPEEWEEFFAGQGITMNEVDADMAALRLPTTWDESDAHYIPGTNSSGFSMPAAGYSNTLAFDAIGIFQRYWTSKDVGGMEGHSGLCIYANSVSINPELWDGHLFSVRCVKDL